MSEFRIVLAIILGLITFAMIRFFPAEVLIWGVVVILNMINLFVTFINLWQARANDRRFLHAGWLGSISVCIGFALMIFFGFIWENRWGVLVVSVPYICGGVVTIITTMIYWQIHRIQKKS